MTGSATAMMIAVCGVVWGGFISLLVFVMRKERKKQSGRQER